MARSSPSMPPDARRSTRCRTGRSSRRPGKSRPRSVTRRWCWYASTCCILPASTWAPRPTAIGAATWLKIKAARSAEFVIGGYTRGQGAREPLGALLLGFWEGKSLRYAGHVGSGLNDEVIGALLQRAAKLKRRNSPFADPPPLHRPTHWLKPQLVAEVTFSEWTPGGAL